MNTEKIIEAQRKQKLFYETDLGRLFETFVNLHASAWQLDERSGWNGHDKTAKKAWDALTPIEKELRETLMKIAGVV